MNTTPVQSQVAYLERDRVKIAYKSTGTGDTTLLFVHGSFIDMSYWDAQVGYFKQRYRVLTIDLPGHGMSGSNRKVWNIGEYGADVCSLISQLGLKNVILVGHSMGGDVILEAAVKCPASIRGFVGVDNFKNAGTALPDEIQVQADHILEMLKTDFANTSEGYARQVLLAPSTSKDITDRVVSDYRDMDKNIGFDLISSAFTYYERERALMEQLKFKMYLINVDNFPTNESPLQKYAASGHELSEMKGTCHFPMIENPDEFNRLLQEIVGKIAKE